MLRMVGPRSAVVLHTKKERFQSAVAHEKAVAGVDVDGRNEGQHHVGSAGREQRHDSLEEEVAIGVNQG